MSATTRAPAESLYTGARTARVKTATDRYTARCLTPRVALRRIRQAAEDAVTNSGDLVPYAPGPPYAFAVEFATASAAASVMSFPQLGRVDDRLVA